VWAGSREVPHVQRWTASVLSLVGLPVSMSPAPQGFQALKILDHEAAQREPIATVRVPRRRGIQLAEGHPVERVGEVRILLFQKTLVKQ